jgi:hypothetical protein
MLNPWQKFNGSRVVVNGALQRTSVVTKTRAYLKQALVVVLAAAAAAAAVVLIVVVVLVVVVPLGTSTMKAL